MVMCGNVYHRITYSKKNLKKKDFIMGFGYYSEILNRIHQARIKYNEQNPDKNYHYEVNFMINMIIVLDITLLVKKSIHEFIHYMINN